jgi:hypothetical protein
VIITYNANIRINNVEYMLFKIGRKLEKESLLLHKVLKNDHNAVKLSRRLEARK